MGESRINNVILGMDGQAIDINKVLTGQHFVEAYVTRDAYEEFPLDCLPAVIRLENFDILVQEVGPGRGMTASICQGDALERLICEGGNGQACTYRCKVDSARRYSGDLVLLASTNTDGNSISLQFRHGSIEIPASHTAGNTH